MSLNFDGTSRIRVLVVDDSAFMRSALSRMIDSQHDMEVVGTACSASVALEKIPTLDPDVVTLDVMMPGMDGLGTLRCIMIQFPRPVIMVSSQTEKHEETKLEALSAGAFDCVSKRLSDVSLEIAHIKDTLTSRIRAAVPLHRTHAMLAASRKPPHSAPLESYVHPLVTTLAVIAIGLSTGGPKCLSRSFRSSRRTLLLPSLSCNICRAVLSAH